MKLRMAILIFISLSLVSSNCFNDKGIEIYSKNMSQCQNPPVDSSDLSSFMASPVSQSILRQDIPQSSTPSMYSALGMSPNNHSQNISPGMSQSLGGVISSNCGKHNEEQQYNDCLNSQIQNIKKQVLACKSIYGEDSSRCCVNGGGFKDLNALNMTTKTGIPCLDAMTFTGLGPVTDIMKNAMYTSGRSDNTNQDWPVYGSGYMQTNCNGTGNGNSMYNTMNSNGFYPQTTANGFNGQGTNQQLNSTCNTIPPSFCNMMNGPILGQSGYKKSKYKGDIVNLNEWCKKGRCNDGCPTQTDCKKGISGGSPFIPIVQYMNSQPYVNQPYVNQSVIQPYATQPVTQPYATQSYPQLMAQYSFNQPYVTQPYVTQPYANQPYQQPYANQPYPTQPSYHSPKIKPNNHQPHYDDDSSNGQYNNNNNNSRKSQNRNSLDGIFIIEPNTNLHNYILKAISDPSRIQHVGDSRKKKGWRGNQKGKEKNSTERKKKEPPVARKKKKSKEESSSSTEDSSETQNVFQDNPTEEKEEEKEAKRYVNLKERKKIESKKKKDKKESNEKIKEEKAKVEESKEE